MNSKLIAQRYKSTNKTHKFLPNEQIELARRIAWFWTNKQITEFAKSEFDKDMSERAYYEIKQSEKWKPVIEQFREEYISACAEVPLFHKKKRLEELQEQFDFYKAKKMRKEALAVLKEFRDEAEGRRGDVSFHLTQVTHNEFHQMSDETLQREKMKTLEQLEKVRKLKLLTKGESNGVGREGTEAAIEIEEGAETEEEELHHE